MLFTAIRMRKGEWEMRTFYDTMNNNFGACYNFRCKPKMMTSLSAHDWKSFLSDLKEYQSIVSHNKIISVMFVIRFWHTVTDLLWTYNRMFPLLYG